MLSKETKKHKRGHWTVWWSSFVSSDVIFSYSVYWPSQISEFIFISLFIFFEDWRHYPCFNVNEQYKKWWHPVLPFFCERIRQFQFILSNIGLLMWVCAVTVGSTSLFPNQTYLELLWSCLFPHTIAKNKEGTLPAHESPVLLLKSTDRSSADRRKCRPSPLPLYPLFLCFFSSPADCSP